MEKRNLFERFKNIAARGGIIVFFIMAFEVMIMISPFAFFFYSVFNPVLHWLESYPATGWLTAFFLPHMILPPTPLLKAIRILGSVLFVVGAATFTICALQVYLGYVMPADYVMQGMIADTGGEFHLHQHHNTFALITDWVLNPFDHLRRSPSVQMAAMHNADPAMVRSHHCSLRMNAPTLQCEPCPMRRIVFVEVDHDGEGRLAKEELFSFDVARTPVCFVDINTQTGEIINAKQVGKATAWMDVPTPAI